MTHWMRPPDLDRDRRREPFDPVTEGARYRLASKLLLAIWDRACADATDSSGRRDIEQAQQRFHAIAKRIAAPGRRLHPGPGRLTRVGVEIDDEALRAWLVDELAPRTPGRETLVTVEARRWAGRTGQATEARERGSDATAAHDGPERQSHELPGKSEMIHLLAALQRPRETETSRRDSSLPPSMPGPLVIDLTAPSSERAEAANPESGRLPSTVLDRMEHAYGQRFDDVEIHPDSPEVPAGEEAFTQGRHIYFGHGVLDLDSEHGEHVIAHELAHVAQQSQPATATDMPLGRPASRAALEADAHQAAMSVLAGRQASVGLFAPRAAALGFSKGQPAKAAPGAGGPAKSARSAGSAPPSGAAPAAPRPKTSGSPAPKSGAAPARPNTPAARPPGAGAGSAAPAAASQKGPAGDGLLVPEAPAALTPAAAGRLQQVDAKNQGVATATTTLPTAQQQTDVARAAVVEPQAEQDGKAQHQVVAAVDDRPPPSPEIVEACAHIREVIKAKRPPDEDKLVEAKPREMAEEAGNQMSAGVEQRAGTVREGYAGMQDKPQGTPDTQPVPATLPPERAETPSVDAAAAAPDSLKHDDVSLEGDVEAQKKQIEDAGMNTEAGQLVKDGPIGDARGGADDLQNMAKTDPQKVLADQAAAIAGAKGDMVALQAAAEKALADARAGTVAHMDKHTTGVKGSEEQQRATAGAQMQAVFTRTQSTVDRLLAPLSGNAVKRWETGVDQISTEFETSLAETKRKVDERHSGTFGGVVSTWDGWTGLPDWVTADYDRAEAKFADGATNLLTDISRDVNVVVEDCKKLIDQARTEIDDIVKALPANLQTWAKGEAAKLNTQLDQLNNKVEQTRGGLNKDLINRANGAVQQVRERVADLREQAKGLLGKIADAIGEFLKDPAKAIINGLLHILGIPPPSFWALIDKLGDVISGIAAEPKKFANTLMAGVGQGFQQFFHNLPMHLGQALFQWLFSKLGEAGVTMPTDFSIKSILTLALEVMGITWVRIKTILAKHIGAENAELLDQAVQLIKVLMDKGPAGVFEMIKEQLDPGMIIDAIKDAAIQYVMEAIIVRVTARILMMLNPAGAILQAIEAIYRVIKWVIDNAARIFTLIESVVNGAAMILAGNTSGVANLVESSLVRLMVPVIDFLAGYLGLGGIPNAIKNVILGLQGKVEKILDRVIGFIVDKAKALWQALKAKGKGKDGKDKDGKDKDKDKDDYGPEKQEKVDAGLADLDAEDHKRMHEGRLAKTDAEQIAVLVKSRHPVFSAIRVIVEGDTLVYGYSASPEKKKVAGKVDDADAKAKQALDEGAAQAAALKAASERGKRAYLSGKAREEAKRQELEARPGGVALPTKTGAKGIDTAYLTDDDTLEIHEVKAGGEPRALKPRGRSRKPPAGKSTIEVSAGEGEAARRIVSDPDAARQVATGESVLIQEGRVIQNQLSAISENLRDNIDKMFKTIESAKLDKKIADRINKILAGETGMLKFVIDIEKGATMSDEQRKAASVLIQTAFDELAKRSEWVQRQIEILYTET